ncbi:MAG: glycosyltransferase [Candidatus Aenigmarchaeota archaeon]|nr:glycosyltransferase [Candidatus Aenigmarchaeota archaeon]
MIDIVAVGKILFYICMVPLIIYSLKFYVLSVSSVFVRRKGGRDAPKLATLPKVSVHIPVYNDPIVVKCIKHCLAFDYPKDKFEVIVIDDSDDGETSRAIDSLKAGLESPNLKVLRRNARRGFKAGALNDAMKASMGEIIVVFDSDYKMGRDFLKKVVQPFGDGGTAFVQTRWDYLNPGKNRVSRLAMTCYNAFHQCSMPVKERIGTAIFCGTGGAIRKDVLQKAGGWNEDSIGEDIDLTVRILEKGYRQAYLPYVRASGEVPVTLKAFVKQQQRWAYATTKVMKQYLGSILASEKLTRKQKLDLVFIVSGFLVFPFILGVSAATVMTLSAWFGPNTSGEIFNMANLARSARLALHDFLSLEGVVLLVLSSGYIFQCIVGLAYEKRYKDILSVPWIFIVGLVIQVTNTIAVMKALLGMKQGFYKTPKSYYRGG